MTFLALMLRYRHKRVWGHNPENGGFAPKPSEISPPRFQRVLDDFFNLFQR